MKNCFAKLILFCLVLCTCMLCHITGIQAQEEYTEGPLTYEIEDGSITITGYFGNKETVTIPSQIAGIPVSAVAAGAFADTTLKEVYLPDTIMTIEEGAFSQNIRVVRQATDSVPVSEETDAPAQETPQTSAEEKPAGTSNGTAQNTQPVSQNTSGQSSGSSQSTGNASESGSSAIAQTAGSKPISGSTVAVSGKTVGTDEAEVSLVSEEDTKERITDDSDASAILTESETENKNRMNPFIVGLFAFFAILACILIWAFIHREEE